LVIAIPGGKGLLADPHACDLVSSDGITSLETELMDDGGPTVVSLFKLISSESVSHGGLNRMPNDPWFGSDDAGPDLFPRLSDPAGSGGISQGPCFGRLARRRPGMAVMANNAATDGGIDRESC
jgi:hypothetical protein